MNLLNPPFEIATKDLGPKLNISLNGMQGDYNRVIPIRFLSRIDHVSLPGTDAFEQVIRNVPLRTGDGSEKIMPYREAHIELVCGDPKRTYPGQTFIHIEKMLGLLRGLEGRLFTQFLSGGIAKAEPVVIYGQGYDGQKALALYSPPILEVHEGKEVLIDGTHRSYLCRAAGTSMNFWRITGAKAKLPFTPIQWENVRLVEDKPPIEQRYRDLDKKLFRDLGAVGIDG